jgi:hypothetical protein
MKTINKLVNENVVGSRVQVTVEQGVNYLIKCKYEVSKNTILPTPINPESTTYFVTLSNGNTVNFWFENKNVYNTVDHVCNIVITSNCENKQMGGINTNYDSLEFMDELLQYIKNNTGKQLNYDCFGNPV